MIFSRGLALSGFEGFVVWQSPEAPSSTKKTNLLANGDTFQITHSHTWGDPHSLASCFGPCEDVDSWSALALLPGPAVDTATLWNFGFDSVASSLFASSQGGALAYRSTPSTMIAAADTSLSVGGDPTGCDTTSCYFQGELRQLPAW